MDIVARLKYIAEEWENHTEYLDPHSGGKLEHAIAVCKQETINELGQQLAEALSVNDSAFDYYVHQQKNNK